ncbi:MAG TPA: DUF1643 domain-containing protein [Burkholderiales bacterium]|nr:DUF1643 domain-containing protein [Burkholderiales bacterium]
MLEIAITPSGAQFSRCRRWRYLLWRRWDPSRPVANFLMLNPSTADELKLDPSCTRARNYAERWGYGGLIVTNIFGWRATDPKVMRSVKDPVGRGNDAAILRAAREAQVVVCAWGTHGEHLGRGTEVLELLKGIRLHALRVTADGHPSHPLYLPQTLTPAEFQLPSPVAATTPGPRG